MYLGYFMADHKRFIRTQFTQGVCVIPIKLSASTASSFGLIVNVYAN